MKLLICSFLSIFIIVSTVEAQTEKISELKQKHSEYLKEINNANRLLSSKSASKTNTLNQLELLNAKINTQKELVSTLKEGLLLLDQEIHNNKLLLDEITKDVTELRFNYAQLVIEANKMSRNSYSEFMLLFSSESFSEGYRRFQLLRQYSSYRKKQGLLLNETLIKHDSILNQQTIMRSSKNTVYEEVSLELNKMEKTVASKQSFISKLNTDQNWLRSKIKSNLKKSRKLELEIENLIYKESQNVSNIAPSDFLKYRGKLSWPVNDGIVTSTFGEHNHPSLKGVKVKNNGIDITTNKQNDVQAIFSGSVSRVIAIPGYNKAVIIRHGNYLTVYANLKDVNVKNGETVKKNQSIGKIFTSSTDNNAILHFEVWEGNKKTNPLQWLSKNL